MSTPVAEHVRIASANRGARLQPWLVADIGGTNARFGWVQDDRLGVMHVRKLPVKAYAGLTHAIRAYLSEMTILMGSAHEAPHKAAFAVATAVTGDEIDFTNSEWRFSRTAVQRDLQLAPIRGCLQSQRAIRPQGIDIGTNGRTMAAAIVAGVRH